MKHLFLSLLLLGVAFMPAGAAPSKSLINVDSKGLALQGYDPVAFFKAHQPVKGKPEYSSTYRGAVYHFSSKENEELFAMNPAQYEPDFGGYCAYGVAQGRAVPIEVDAFQIVDGKLLLQYDKDIRDKFNEDQSGNLKKARQNWPGIVQNKGK